MIDSGFLAFFLFLALLATFFLQRATVHYYQQAYELERRKVARYEAMFPDYVRDAVERRVMEEVSRGE